MTWVTSPARSSLMKKVRQKRTSLEDRVALLLRQAGARYRRNSLKLPGSPDFSNQSRGWAVQVHGCFWHGHENCRLAKVPAANHEMWIDKLRSNRNRDRRKLRELKAKNLRVLTVWQCQLQDEGRVRRALEKLLTGDES